MPCRALHRFSATGATIAEHASMMPRYDAAQQMARDPFSYGEAIESIERALGNTIAPARSHRHVASGGPVLKRNKRPIGPVLTQRSSTGLAMSDTRKAVVGARRTQQSNDRRTKSYRKIWFIADIIAICALFCFHWWHTYAPQSESKRLLAPEQAKERRRRKPEKTIDMDTAARRAFEANPEDIRLDRRRSADRESSAASVALPWIRIPKY